MGRKPKTKAGAAAAEPAPQLPVPQLLPQPSTATTAAAGEAGPVASVSALQQLEDKKKRLSAQLDAVAVQIYDLETRYLQGRNPAANALTGYENLRTTLGASKPASKLEEVAPEDRIFSGSSTVQRA